MTTRSLPCTQLLEGVPRDLPSPDEVLGRAAGENFTVASRLLPGPSRRHLMAFYGFARFTDQIGDAYRGDRSAALEWLREETAAALRPQPGPVHPLVGPAARSVIELGIDPQPLFDLIEANRRDQLVGSYRTFDDLLDYCRLSANPVGRLVLGAFGHQEPYLLGLSDSVCTGLQLVEHWQDVREDALAGRVYLPSDDLDRFGVDPSSLTSGPPAPQALRALMAFEVARARSWLQPGTALVAALRGRPRLAVAGFVAGGQAALDGIAGRDFDTLSPPSHPKVSAVVRHLVSTGLTAVRGAGVAA